jgi:NTP pyrophosphatase (non-canonical NTP hydrolase)
MNLNEYQNLAMETAIYPNKGNNLYYPTLGLNGESGEFANLVKKMERDGVFDPEKAIDELGDVLWYVSCCAYELDMTLEEIALYNLEKLRKRYPADPKAGRAEPEEEEH